MPEAPVSAPRLIVQLEQSQVSSVAFSADGKQLLSGGADGTVLLWDAVSGTAVREFDGHGGYVKSAVFSSDGKQVFTEGNDGAGVWDVASGHEIEFSHNVIVWGLLDDWTIWSPDRKWILSSSAGTTQLVNATTKQKIHEFNRRTEQILSAAFSADGKQLLIGSRSGRARLFDSATGTILREFKGSEPDWSLAVSPDGKRVLTGGNKMVHLCNIETGDEIRTFEGHTDRVYFVAFSPDGKQAISRSNDKTVRLWDVASGNGIRNFTGNGCQINAVAFSPDSKQLLIGCSNKSAHLVDAVSGHEIRKFAGHVCRANSVAFSPDSKHVLTGGEDNTAVLWDLVAGREVGQFVGHTGTVRSVAYSPDGKRVLTGSDDKTARLWDAASRTQIYKLEGSAASVRAATFSPDSKFVFSDCWSYDKNQWHPKRVRLWDSSTGKQVKEFIDDSVVTDVNDGILSLAVSPDGKQLAVGKAYTGLRIFDVASGEVVKDGPLTFRQVSSLAFSPDGTQILIANGLAVLWSIGNGRADKAFGGPAGMVTSVAFSSEGKQLLTGSTDGIARQWYSASGHEVHELDGNAGAVTSVAISPNGKWLLTGNRGGTTTIWNAANGERLCDLISYANGGWAVVDPDRHYDASDPDKVEGVCWVIGNEPIDLAQAKQKYYQPGLLAKKLGFEPPK